MQHIFTITTPPERVPCKAMPDGALTGNGDLSVVWGGTTDRIRLYIGKCDFWKGDESAYREKVGGASPLGILEILMPQFPTSPYRVEQDVDRAVLTGYYQDGRYDARLDVLISTEENIILLEMDRSWPGLSVSTALLPLEGNGAVTECGEYGDIRYTVRTFSGPELVFDTSALSALKEVSRHREGNRERIRWAVSVCTNHDSAAFRKAPFTRLAVLDDADFEQLWESHGRWWKNFWSQSSVSLPGQPLLERHWYAGLYTLACCMRNEKFPPGLWGNFNTADGMAWFGDYHLNYNYEAPFYALTSSNHTELTEGYMKPLWDFMPRAKRYAREYMGCRGVYFPVSIGPLGMETDVRADTKEHGHLFLGQKFNAMYGGLIPMMRWHGTRDIAYGRTVYPYLRAVTEFWEDYLVYENGQYHSYNDSINEEPFFLGPDYIPTAYNDEDPISSMAPVMMLMRTMADMAAALGLDEDKIPLWLDIAEKCALYIGELNGKKVLQGTAGGKNQFSMEMTYVFPSGQIGKYLTPELYEAAQNSIDILQTWDNNNTFCSFYPAAVRVGYDPDALLGHMYACIAAHEQPNGTFRFGGGGIENSTAVPMTVNEMLLQSYEGVLRLFPCWNRKENASYRKLRANGAFVVDGDLENGEIRASIFSEKGMPLTVEKPGEGYCLIRGTEKILLTEQVTTVETLPGEILVIAKA